MCAFFIEVIFKHGEVQIVIPIDAGCPVIFSHRLLGTHDLTVL